MTCKTGECGTIHNFSGERKPDGSRTCDCGMFTIKTVGHLRTPHVLWHPNKSLMEALEDETGAIPTRDLRRPYS
jgi:hypothetical protein